MKIYAKCNLTLNVGALRPDGYHDLDMVVCSVSLYDDVRLTFRSDGAVTCTMDGVLQRENSALAAARAFRQAVPDCPGMDIAIDKGIPVMAGLGGSSADAAGVFRLLAEAFPAADVAAIAERVGSDTKYQLSGGFARVRGRGERVESLAVGPADFSTGPALLFCMAAGGVSTAEAFRLAGACAPSDNGALVEALQAGDWRRAARECKNGLFAAAVRLNPAVGRVRRELADLGAAAVNMTGSGSGVYALFETREEAEQALTKVRLPAQILTIV